MPSLQPPGQGQGSACSPRSPWWQAGPVGGKGLASLCTGLGSTVLWGTAGQTASRSSLQRGAGNPVLDSGRSWSWALEGISILSLFNSRLYGFVFNVPIADFLKMWLTFIFIPLVNTGAKQINMEEQPLMMNHPFPITSPYTALPSQVWH